MWCPHLFGWVYWRHTEFVNVRECRWCGQQQTLRDDTDRWIWENKED